jgi:hypothetical protein
VHRKVCCPSDLDSHPLSVRNGSSGLGTIFPWLLGSAYPQSCACTHILGRTSPALEPSWEFPLTRCPLPFSLRRPLQRFLLHTPRANQYLGWSSKSQEHLALVFREEAYSVAFACEILRHSLLACRDHIHLSAHAYVGPIRSCESTAALSCAYHELMCLGLCRHRFFQTYPPSRDHRTNYVVRKRASMLPRKSRQSTTSSRIALSSKVDKSWHAASSSPEHIHGLPRIEESLRFENLCEITNETRKFGKSGSEREMGCTLWRKNSSPRINAARAHR